MSDQFVHISAENGLSAPVANGVQSLTPESLATISPEEMLEQMNELIKENYDLKEALKHNNHSMKERFEELSTWKEKQKSERDFYENRFKEVEQRLLEVTSAYEKLQKNCGQINAQKSGLVENSLYSPTVLKNELGDENEQLKSQMVKLQAEKKDLLAIVSDLQLRLSVATSEDSFIEIRMAEDENAKLKPVGSVKGTDVATSMGPSEDGSKNLMGSEELAVKQLLSSLGEETEKIKRLETELQTTTERLAELELQRKMAHGSETGTQTNLTAEEEKKEEPKEVIISSQVEPLKLKVKMLHEELQVANTKLDDAELMKKNLQEKCHQLEKRVSEMQVECEEKRQLQYAIRKLELQVESMKSESLIEQAKLEHEKSQFETLHKAYKEKHFELDEAMKAIENLKRRESQCVPKEVMEELNDQLELAEKALATKQRCIDEMKQRLFKQEEEMDTMGLLRAQLDVYCADFHAERAAREAIHEEKEQLTIQLGYMVKENSKLKEELDNLGRQAIGELQMRNTSIQENLPRNVRREEDEQPHSIPMHACPKCGDVLPDLDTLQIHVMDCIT